MYTRHPRLLRMRSRRLTHCVVVAGDGHCLQVFRIEYFVCRDRSYSPVSALTGVASFVLRKYKSCVIVSRVCYLPARPRGFEATS